MEAIDGGTFQNRMVDVDSSTMEDAKGTRTTSWMKDLVWRLAPNLHQKKFACFQKPKVHVLDSIRDGSMITLIQPARNSPTQDAKGTRIDSLIGTHARKLATQPE